MPTHPFFATTALAACAMLSSTASAQSGSGSAWTTLSPPGGVNPAAIDVGQTLLCYRDGLYMRVYSAITRQWHAHQPSFGTSVVVRDNLVAVPESDRWTAFSPSRGRFETLLVNPGTSGWVASHSLFVVRDGNIAHVFSTWTGVWSSHTVPSDWLANVEDRVVLFSDYAPSSPSQGASIFDGTRGVWIDVPPQPGGLRSSTGPGTVLIRTPAQCLGYSTQRGWLQTIATPAITFGSTFGDGFDDLVGDDGVFYSGLSGALTSAPFPPPNPWFLSTSYDVSGHAVRAWQQNLGTQYVAGTAGSWLPVPGNGVPDADARSYMLFRDGVDVHAFHVIGNQWHTHTFATEVTLFDQGADVALRVDGATQRCWLFSGITGQWTEAPPEALPEPGPYLQGRAGDIGAVLPSANGLLGFAAADNSFTAVVAPAAQPLAADNVLAASDADHVYLFDTPRRRWITEPLPAPASLQARGHVLLGQSAGKLVGYSARGGHVESLQLVGAALGGGLGLTAHPDLAYVHTAGELHAFSAFPEHFSWTGGPFAPGCSIGSQQRHQIQIGSGDLAVFAIGMRAPTAIPITPFGELWLDLAATATALLAPSGSESRALVDYALPLDPTLRGSEWFVQPLIWRAGGQPYLPASTSFVVL